MKLLLSLSTLSLGLLPLLAQHTHAQQANDQQTVEAEYLPLEKIRSFYKLMPLQNTREGVRSVGNAGTTINFGPDKKEITIGGYRWQLSHPVRDDGAGDLLISRTDLVKLIDPVLRPTYITNRYLVRTVVIDPGHGGYDSGTTKDKLREVDFNLALAHDLKEELSKRGYTVLLTHEQNRHLSDQQRIAIANEADAAIFISLHLNSGHSEAQGIETYTAAPDCPGTQRRPANNHDAANAALAFAVHSSLVAATGATDGACRRARYNLLNSVECPAIMIMPGYITHKEEAARLETEEYRQKLASAITNGVATFALALNPGASLEPAAEAEVDPEPPTPVKMAPPASPPSRAKSNSNQRKATKSKPRRQNKSNNKRKGKRSRR